MMIFVVILFYLFIAPFVPGRQMNVPYEELTGLF